MPEKFHVKAANGEIDWQATALKVAAEGYAPLERRLHAGDAPPKAPEDYAPTVPDGMSLDALKADPLYVGFLKGAHARGMTNAHVSYVLDAMAQRMAPDPAAAEVELRKEWSTDEAMTTGLQSAFRATAAFAGDQALQQRLDAKFGSDPDFIRLMARVGKELSEDKPAATDLTMAEQDTLESLMQHPSYLDGKHPQHAQTVAKVRGLYAKKTGGA